MSEQVAVQGQTKQINLLKVLGPVHVWALGVGIVLVGEFMGWNYGVGKGGAFGALISCWVIGLLESTVKVHVKTILKKLAASNRTQAAMMALDLGLAHRTGEPLPRKW